jgi:hypothetical protein
MATKARGKRAERRTVTVARQTFKAMAGNQTPNTPGKRESIRRKKAA